MSSIDHDALPDADKALLARTKDPARHEVIACSLQLHRRPDRLKVGHAVPALRLAPLDGGDAVALHDDERPTLLIFGSYT